MAFQEAGYWGMDPCQTWLGGSYASGVPQVYQELF